MARAPHVKPAMPYAAPSPPPRDQPSSPPILNASNDVDESDDDESEYQFDCAQLLPSSSTAPIDIPGTAAPSAGSIRAPARRAPLPIAALRSLDRHNWDSECALLGKWAAGAGVGAYANSVADGFFAPGSPPRRKFYY